MSQVCVDQDDFVVVGGELCIRAGLGDLQQIIVYTSDAVFTKSAYPDLARLRVRVQAGGGGGGGVGTTDSTQAGAGAGGGAGGYAETIIEAADLQATTAIVVGAGGGADVDGPGSPGGDSSFGTHAAATGGRGGASIESHVDFRPTVAGQGGQGISGMLRHPGGDGQPGLSKGDPEQLHRGGRGGRSQFGGGRRGGTGGAGHDGRANTGEGGSGAGIGDNSSSEEGGEGASGIVIVEIYH
jgi:hypothetical protein